MVNISKAYSQRATRDIEDQIVKRGHIKVHPALLQSSIREPALWFSRIYWRERRENHKSTLFAWHYMQDRSKTAKCCAQDSSDYLYGC